MSITNLTHNSFFMYVYFYSLRVSGSHVPIIRRVNCINTASGICRSVYVTVWCAGLDENESHPNLHTRPVKNRALHYKNWGLRIISMIVSLRRAFKLWQHWVDGGKHAVGTLCLSLTYFYLYIIFNSETFLLHLILQYNLNEAYLNTQKKNLYFLSHIL